MRQHRVWAEVDLEAARRNVHAARRVVGPDVAVLVVVKADGYGHGAVPVGRACLEAGAGMLGVGDSSEALALRQAGIVEPVLVLGALLEEEIAWVVSYDVRVTVHSLYMIRRIEEEARRQGRRVCLHLKVDTGMGRLGVSPTTAPELARRIADSPHLVLEGVCSHLASGTEKRFTEQQVRKFRSVLDALDADGLRPKYRHVANTLGCKLHPSAHYNMVRLGAAIYGIDPANLTRRGDYGFEPILTLRTQVAYLKTVPAGTPVGYGRTYRTQRRTRLATLPVGYNDGYPYLLSNRGHVLVQGRRAPVVGTVTMDYTVVDVTRVPGVRVGEAVTLLGRDGEQSITAEDIARVARTVPYEVACSIGKRVRRVYV